MLSPLRSWCLARARPCESGLGHRPPWVCPTCGGSEGCSVRALGYRCSVCGVEYSLEAVTYTCPADGGNLDVVLDAAAIAAATTPERISQSRDYSIWRYTPLLPV